MDSKSPFPSTFVNPDAAEDGFTPVLGEEVAEGVQGGLQEENAIIAVLNTYGKVADKSKQ